MKEFEKQLVEKYISKVHVESFTEWMIQRLSELGFKIVTSKIVVELKNTGSYRPEWSTKIYYKEKLIAEDNNWHNKEYESASNAIFKISKSNGISIELKRALKDLTRIISVYEHNSIMCASPYTKPEDILKRSDEFIKILKHYDSQDREYLKK